VQALKKGARNCGLYRQLIEDTKVVLNHMPNCSIGHIKREENSAAHYLAKEAMSQDVKQV
jgi:hypothetical protein